MMFAKIVSTLGLFLFGASAAVAQSGQVTGLVRSDRGPVPGAAVRLEGAGPVAAETITDSAGAFGLTAAPGLYTLTVAAPRREKIRRPISLGAGVVVREEVNLPARSDQDLGEVVVTGTLKAISRSESPVPVEVYSSAYFKKNPTPNLFEALQNVNGVRPQLNCNICNTGDIHINGLEGPYTMVLIDGMPIVSALSTVYGLSGIPNALIDRIEVVKGPASSLYGSEAVGGLINIITKNPQTAPLLSADAFGTSYGETNVDLGLKLRAGPKAAVLTGINYFRFQNPVDRNGDGFTDVTQQNRISVFQKWAMTRTAGRIFNVAARYVYEDRWGGDVRWTPSNRGGSDIYGESIYTNRLELLGKYQLPTREHLTLWGSFNQHDQDSRYGTHSYIAQQRIAFGQLLWTKSLRRHDLLAGLALRYTFYDDNTPATASADPLRPANLPSRTWLPGAFVQEELKLAADHRLLLGFRYDYNTCHGGIYTPRLAYKWTLRKANIVRVNLGTGYRVVNLFTEDHAALTGAREVVVQDGLQPERSYNANLNYLRTFAVPFGYVGVDASAFYTYFTNRIVGNYDLDPNKIVYNNLDGHAESRGITLNLDVSCTNGLRITAGGTLLDATLVNAGVRQQQILTEHFSGTWAVSYALPKLRLSLDYTGNVYSPMRLPLLGPLDPRRATSPWWSLQNIQVTYRGFRNLEFYGGVKNLLNWTPNRNNPFLIARTADPFDKNVQFGAGGQVVATPDNPYALSFDPSYVYAPNQGIRGFLGVRWTVQH